jgi:hypothetical protein
MVPGHIWLGTKVGAAHVVFSSGEPPSWWRRFVAGSVFYSGTGKDEVELLGRGWIETKGERAAFHCPDCRVLVCDLKNNESTEEREG